MLPKRKINPAFPVQGAVSSFTGFTPLFPPRLESVHSPSSHAVTLRPRGLHQRVFHQHHTRIASSPGWDLPAGCPALLSSTEQPELEGTPRIIESSSWLPTQHKYPGTAQLGKWRAASNWNCWGNWDGETWRLLGLGATCPGNPMRF